MLPAKLVDDEKTFFSLSRIGLIAQPMSRFIYKIATESLWREAEAKGVFVGAPVDLADGYIHFSTVEQVAETAAKHFAGQDGLVLAAIDTELLTAPLKYEAARNGALFPHLYEPLDLAAVVWVRPLPLGQDGRHIFPEFDI